MLCSLFSDSGAQTGTKGLKREPKHLDCPPVAGCSNPPAPAASVTPKLFVDLTLVCCIIWRWILRKDKTKRRPKLDQRRRRDESRTLPSQSTWPRILCGCCWGTTAPSTPRLCSSARFSPLAAHLWATVLHKGDKKYITVFKWWTFDHLHKAALRKILIQTEPHLCFWTNTSDSSLQWGWLIDKYRYNLTASLN